MKPFVIFQFWIQFIYNDCVPCNCARDVRMIRLQLFSRIALKFLGEMFNIEFINTFYNADSLRQRDASSVV
jgi:hypothetical protein